MDNILYRGDRQHTVAATVAIIWTITFSQETNSQHTKTPKKQDEGCIAKISPYRRPSQDSELLYKVTVCIGETELSIDFTHVREIL